MILLLASVQRAALLRVGAPAAGILRAAPRMMSSMSKLNDQGVEYKVCSSSQDPAGCFCVSRLPSCRRRLICSLPLSLSPSLPLSR